MTTYEKLRRATNPPLAQKHAEALVGFLATVRADTDFTRVVTWEDSTIVGLWLEPDGRDLPCLAIAMDVLGNWSVFTTTGQVRQYLKSEVR